MVIILKMFGARDHVCAGWYGAMGSLRSLKSGNSPFSDIPHHTGPACGLLVASCYMSNRLSEMILVNGLPLSLAEWLYAPEVMQAETTVLGSL